MRFVRKTCIFCFLFLLVLIPYSEPASSNSNKNLKNSDLSQSLSSTERFQTGKTKKSKSTNTNPTDDTAKTALFVIDMQKQYLDANFPGFVPNTDKLPNTINEIRKYFREKLKENYIEIFTVDCLMKNSLCVLGKDEVQISTALIPETDYQRIKRVPIHPNLDVDSIEALSKLVPDLTTSKIFILEKAGEKAEYSAFGETKEGLNKYGKGKDSAIANRILQALEVKNVYVVGLAYQQCVLFTAADAAFLKYKTFIVENATNSSVFTKDRVKGTASDADNLKKQEVENDKVAVMVNNKFNGLPRDKDEVLKIVSFNGKGFVEK